MVGVAPPATTARVHLLQEYVARELQLPETDYMSDKMLDDVVAEAAANGWLTQANVRLVNRKVGTEKLRTVANILKERNSMALVDAQLKQVQEEKLRERAAAAAAEKERTTAQSQTAFVKDLRAVTPNRERKPWKPTRGGGTANQHVVGGDSPRRLAGFAPSIMGHDESTLMKKKHDSKYGPYSATAVPTASPRLVRPDGTAMTVTACRNLDHFHHHLISGILKESGFTAWDYSSQSA